MKNLAKNLQTITVEQLNTISMETVNILQLKELRTKMNIELYNFIIAKDERFASEIKKPKLNLRNVAGAFMAQNISATKDEFVAYMVEKGQTEQSAKGEYSYTKSIIEGALSVLNVIEDTKEESTPVKEDTKEESTPAPNKKGGKAKK